MRQFTVTPIGKIEISGGNFFIRLDPQYRPALQALEGFGHLNVLWWFDGLDNPQARSTLETPCPYKKAPDIMGIFATRSPARPNPIALSTAGILRIDSPAGSVQIDYIDANNGSPILDLKPYTPSMDRVETPEVPEWCAHWPRSLETSGDFDWENEFNF